MDKNIQQKIKQTVLLAFMSVTSPLARNSSNFFRSPARAARRNAVFASDYA